MASIYRRNRIYWISYRLSGKTYNESLKTKDLATAKYIKNIKEQKLAENKDIRINKKMMATDVLSQYLKHLELKITFNWCTHNNIILCNPLTRVPAPG